MNKRNLTPEEINQIQYERYVRMENKRRESFGCRVWVFGIIAVIVFSLIMGGIMYPA